MSHLKNYKSELITYLGRFYQDTTIFYFDMLPDRIQKNIEILKPFLNELQQKGYIEIEYSPTFILKIIKVPPSNKELS